jgi:hypothetical protein
MYEGAAAWCFVTVPQTTATKIRKRFRDEEEGWGRLKTTATVKNTSWQTSVWFDTKAQSYLLPVKRSIRQKEKLAIGTLINVELTFT